MCVQLLGCTIASKAKINVFSVKKMSRVKLHFFADFRAGCVRVLSIWLHISVLVKCLMLLLLLVIMDLADPGFQRRLTRSHLARCQEVRSCSGKVGIITNIGQLLPTNDHNVTGKYIPATTYNLVQYVERSRISSS